AGLKMYSAEPPKLDAAGVSVLAFIANRTGKLEKFLPIQRLALKRNPSPQTYKEVSALLLSLKKYDELASTFEEMMKKFPLERNARQLGELANFYRLADKPEAAIKAAR